MLSPRIMLQLLQEAKGVPVMFALLLPSGNIVFEVSGCIIFVLGLLEVFFCVRDQYFCGLITQEFTDATISLNWKTDTFKLAD